MAVGSAEGEGDLGVVHQGLALVGGDEGGGLRLEERATGGLGLVGDTTGGLSSRQRDRKILFNGG